MNDPNSKGPWLNNGPLVFVVFTLPTWERWWKVSPSGSIVWHKMRSWLRGDYFKVWRVLYCTEWSERQKSLGLEMSGWNWSNSFVLFVYFAWEKKTRGDSMVLKWLCWVCIVPVTFESQSWTCLHRNPYGAFVLGSLLINFVSITDPVQHGCITHTLRLLIS